MAILPSNRRIARVAILAVLLLIAGSVSLFTIKAQTPQNQIVWLDNDIAAFHARNNPCHVDRSGNQQRLEKSNLKPPSNRANFNSEMVVVTKTGSQVAQERLSLQYRSFLHFAENVVIASDARDTFRGHPIYDVLERLSCMEDVRTNVKYQPYLYAKSGLKEPTASESWDLDAYKFIPEVQLAWELYPNKKWYLFIDDDTYIHWPQLLRFLPNLDENQPYYLGERNFYTDHTGETKFDGFEFIHGGGGIILSKRTMEIINEKDAARFQSFSAHANFVCCGDVILSMALQSCNIKLNLKESSEMFCNKAISNTRFNSRRWCGIMLSHHYLQAEDYERISALSSKRWVDLFNELTRFRNLRLSKGYDFTDAPLISVPTKSNVKKAEDCKAHCSRSKQCLAWSLNLKTDECRLAPFVHPGHEKAGFVSGAMQDRLDAMTIQCDKFGSSLGNVMDEIKGFGSLWK